jgi:hypothetical protein
MAMSPGRTKAALAALAVLTVAPGYSSILPKNKAPLAMTLKLNGYATAQFGEVGKEVRSPVPGITARMATTSAGG